MKCPSTLIFFLFMTLSVQAQNSSETMASVSNVTNSMTFVSDYNSTNRQATFKGSIKEMTRYFSEAFVYTSNDRENGFEGTIIVRCRLDSSGHPEKAWIVKSVHPVIDERAKLAVLAMPQWEPAIKNGSRVSAVVDIPFELKLR